MSAISIKMHLEGITTEQLLQTKRDGFVPMASVHNMIYGSIQLGVNCKGNFVVVESKNGSNIKWEYDTPEEAISKYTELLTDGE